MTNDREAVMEPTADPDGGSGPSAKLPTHPRAVFGAVLQIIVKSVFAPTTAGDFTPWPSTFTPTLRPTDFMIASDVGKVAASVSAGKVRATSARAHPPRKYFRRNSISLRCQLPSHEGVRPDDSHVVVLLCLVYHSSRIEGNSEIVRSTRICCVTILIYYPGFIRGNRSVNESFLQQLPAGTCFGRRSSLRPFIFGEYKST